MQTSALIVCDNRIDHRIAREVRARVDFASRHFLLGSGAPLVGVALRRAGLGPGIHEDATLAGEQLKVAAVAVLSGGATCVAALVTLQRSEIGDLLRLMCRLDGMVEARIWPTHRRDLSVLCHPDWKDNVEIPF